MKITSAAVVLLLVAAAASAKDCHSKKSNSKLFCYYGKAKDINSCKCSHVILPADADVKSIESLKDKLAGTKILLTVNDFNEGLVNTLKTTKVDGLEINLKKLDSKSDISDFISTVRSKLGSDLYLAITVPSKTETLAKYYDFKALSKSADVFILQTHLLGASGNVTFHPSRLSGLWDVQNTDSVVDLVSGLGAPLSKLVVSAPVQAFKFTLQNEGHTAPGSPAVELSTINRDELCRRMGADKWTLERDQDQAGPYVFREKEWIAFEDSTSMDIKAKYSRVRGLAGLALKDVSQDGGVKCGESLLDSAFNGLMKQARAPRGAVLHSLEREILEVPRKLDNVQVSPYRISRVIDVEGKVHVIRQDTRTEFECSRQGYFVHPRSCGRFYRCVKFDQLSDEFSVFEFDCPAGLAFDNRVEVCVWPGSLPHASACSGSSEIAPVPRERFICPSEPGYYADPENCRWFFACLDHGKSPLSAYEFRCPYGLVYDQERLLCEWPWLVPKCGSGIAIGEEYHYGHEARDGASSLDLYDGLGSLNAVKLGGLSGPLEQPVAKIYSSFTHGNSEYNAGDISLGLTGGEHTHNNYEQGQYVHSGFGNEASFGAGDAGTAYVAAYDNQQAGFGNHNSGSYSFGSKLDSSYNNAGVSGAATFENGAYENNGRYSSGSKLDSSYNNAGASGAATFENGAYANNGRYSSENKYAEANSGSYSFGTKYETNSAANQAGLVYSTGTAGFVGANSAGSNVLVGADNKFANANSGSYSFGTQHASSYENANGASLVTGYVAANSGSQEATNANSGSYSFGTKHASSYANSNAATNEASLVYTSGFASANHAGGNSIVSHDATAHNINSVFGSTNENDRTYIHSESGENAYNLGGAYENGKSSQFGQTNIVGGGASAVAKEGVQIYQHGVNLGVEHVTPVSISHIPVVTAVPIPSVQSSTEFGIYNGGVVANLPDLQYKLEHPSTINAYLNGYSNVSSTARSTAYDFPLSYIATSTESSVPIKTVTDYQQVHDNSEGYHYSKPAISFEEKPKGYLPPPTVQSTYLPAAPQAKSSYSYNQQTSYVQPLKPVTYSFPKSTFVKTFNPIQPAQLNTYTYKQSHVQTQQEGGYHYEKPIIAFEEKPVVHVQPAVTYQEVKHYQKPTIAYEKKTVEHIQPAVTYQEVKHEKSIVQVQPAFQEIKQHIQEGYHYEKPTIAFEEKPVVHVEPAVAYQEVKHEGYHYQKPAIAFEEKPIVHVQPTVVYQHHYEKPTIAFEDKSVVQHTHSYQETKHEAKQEGYRYEKPAIAFEEKPIVHVQQPVVQKVEHIQPAVTYQEVKHEGYHYQKPTIAFEEKPIVHVQQPIVQKVEHIQPAVTYQEVKHEGYHYQKPTIAFEEKPVVHVQQPIVQKVEHIQPAVTYQEVKHEGYHYQKPTIAFEEKPVVHVQQPIIQKVEHIQPAVTYQEVKHEGYHYQKPTIAFEEKPIVHVQQPIVQKVEHIQPAVTYQEVKHEGYHYQTPTIAFEEKPIVQVQKVQPAITYQEINHNVQQIKQEGYHYEKPTIAFEEKPIVPVVQKVEHVQSAVAYQEVKHEGYHYEKPAVAFEEKPVVHLYQKPAVVEQTVQHVYKPAVIQQKAVTYQEIKQYQGYHYDKPSVVFEHSTPQPAVVYQHVEHKVQPVIQKEIKQENYYYEEKPIVRKPALTYQEFKQPIVFEQKPTYKQVLTQTSKPSIISHFSIHSSVDQGYHYEKPEVVFEEKPAQTYLPAPKPTPTYIPVPKPTPTYIPAPQPSYLPAPQPSVDYLPAPQPTYLPVQKYIPIQKVEISHPEPSVEINYENQEPVEEEVIVAKKAYVTGHQGYSYEKPAIKFEEVPFVSSTPKPTLASIVAEIEHAPLREYKYYDSRLESKQPTIHTVIASTAQPETVDYYEEPAAEVYTEVKQSRPIVRYEFSSLDSKYNNYQSVSSTSAPIKEYLPIVAPTKEYLPVVTPTKEYLPVSTRRPITRRPKVTTPKRVYLPVQTTTETYFEISSPENEYLPVTEIYKIKTPAPTTITPKPNREYLPVTRKPNREYLPVTKKPNREYLPATRKPNREYLPVTKTPSREYLPVTSTEPPSREYLPIKSAKQVENYEFTPTRRPKVVKVTKSKSIIKVNDFHPILSAKLGAQCTCVSNTVSLRKKPQRIIVPDYEETPDIQEVTDNDAPTSIEDYKYEPQKIEDYYISKSSTTVEPVTKSKKRPALVIIEEDDTPNKDEIAAAVTTGLKLVKSAVKEGVKEALATKDFDRYGPGGVRGRTETLQGTVDCQRAGLFRHPTHCNKFYACRWDDTKKKFTLHVFNCPVHLTFDNNLGACNWPSQGPACVDNTLLPSD